MQRSFKWVGLGFLLLSSRAFGQDVPPTATPPTEQVPPPETVPAPAPPPEPLPNTVVATPPAAEPCYFGKTTFNGTIDFYGMGNFNNPGGGINALRAFDPANAGGLQLNLAKLTIAHVAEPIGFRLDIGFGLAFTSPLGLAGADPSAGTNPTHAAWHRNLEQAYLSFKVPVGKGLVIDGGKFVTHMGQEVIETRDNWNYSRGLLFSFAIPFFHTGLRALYALSDTLGVGLYWLNGWNSFVEEGSKMRTGGLQLAYNPSPKGSVIFNFIGGRSGLVFGGKPGSESTNRYVVDLVGIYKPTDQLGLGLNFDYGYDDAGPGIKYWGVAAYGRYQIAPWYASALRFEFFQDSDQALFGTMLPGFATGLATAPKDIWEITVTIAELAHTFGPANMLWRLEYRHDQADQAIFQKENTGAEKFQDTITVGTVAYY